ncbi:MAG TPA: 3-phosphoshikimate 1-carboxyvinyltransferase [Tepidisphaeraceae bacterium]|jgi:3-phosphoshikimate 1-carboxyvinyltransferase|nr:3-phosphoshikimate 1-carboxyvinyltransferase [Tepidisphaeraceae bacterium]
MSDLLIQPIPGPFTATITPPGSKSLTNRALVLAALSDGACELTNVLFADDTRVMLDNLQKLGFDVTIDEPARRVRVVGAAGKIPASNAELFCGNSGTTIRFLTALCTLGKGTFVLDGIERMRQRPIGALTAMLKNLGARAGHSPEAEGFPPVQVEAHGLAGGILRYGNEASSQFLSAILMVAPYAKHEVRVDLEPKQTSWPYIAMTMQLMDHFQVTAELIRDPKTGEPKQIIVPHGVYQATDCEIEPDASNATYFLAAAAVSPGSKVTVERLGKQSMQGDVGFADVLHRMGAGLMFGKDFITITGVDELEGVDVNLNGMPDTAQTLAVVALFAKGPTTIRGLHTLRVKETDRLAALQNELTKLGAEAEIEGDVLTVNPPEDGKLKAAKIETYDDHRMAMSFAVAGTRSGGVTIKDVECVGKTYPGFFADLERLRG